MSKGFFLSTVSSSPLLRIFVFVYLSQATETETHWNQCILLLSAHYANSSFSSSDPSLTISTSEIHLRFLVLMASFRYFSLAWYMYVCVWGTSDPSSALLSKSAGHSLGWHLLETECLYPPKHLCMLNSNTSCDGITRWGLWEVIR